MLHCFLGFGGVVPKICTGCSFFNFGYLFSFVFYVKDTSRYRRFFVIIFLFFLLVLITFLFNHELTLICTNKFATTIFIICVYSCPFVVPVFYFNNSKIFIFLKSANLSKSSSLSLYFSLIVFISFMFERKTSRIFSSK